MSRTRPTPPQENDGHARDPAPLVARSHPVPDLRQVLAGQQRRRLRGPGRGHRPPGLPVLARRGRYLAVPDHAVARRGLGLRRLGLPGCAPAAGHPGRPGPADRRSGPAGHAGPARPRAQPHQQRPRLVRRGGQRPRLAAPGVLRVGRPCHRRRAAEQLAGRDGRAGLDPGPGQRAVLPAQLPAQPARPELVESRGAPGFPGDPAVLVRPRRGGIPDRRRPRALQGRPAPRRPARARRGAGPPPVRPGPGVQRQPARVARRVPGLAEDRRELPGAPGAARRDLGRRPERPGRLPRPGG